MSYSMPDVLAPAAIQAQVSRLKVNNTRLQNRFGAGFTGDVSSINVRNKGGRNFGWDIFDDIRDVGEGSGPATAPTKVARSPVGHVNGRYPRHHEEIDLNFEEIHNIRQIGGQPGDLDVGGVAYIEGQIKKHAQRTTNHREFLMGGMLRGKCYFNASGNRLIPSYTSGTYTIDWQIPAGNKTTLDMLGAGAIISALWSSASTDIPGQILAIDKAYQVLTGRRLRHIECDSTIWNYVQTNTAVKNLAGSANTPVASMVMADDGTEDFTATLRGMEWIKWHVNNEVLDIDGTTTQVIPASKAIFYPDIDDSWFQFWNGSEVVVTPEGLRNLGPQFGAYFYAYPKAHPAGYGLVNLHNGIPALFVPKAIAIGDVA